MFDVNNQQQTGQLARQLAAGGPPPSNIAEAGQRIQAAIPRPPAQPQRIPTGLPATAQATLPQQAQNGIPFGAAGFPAPSIGAFTAPNPNQGRPGGELPPGTPALAAARAVQTPNFQAQIPTVPNAGVPNSLPPHLQNFFAPNRGRFDLPQLNLASPNFGASIGGF